MDECCETGETESSREMSGAIFGSTSSGGGVCVYGLGGSGTKTTDFKEASRESPVLSWEQTMRSARAALGGCRFGLPGGPDGGVRCCLTGLSLMGWAAAPGR